jgi:hypothetical protein
MARQQVSLPKDMDIEEIPRAIEEFIKKMIADQIVQASEIKSAIRYYVDQYNARDVPEAQEGERIRHDDLANQVGYIYKYYNSHVYFVLEALEGITMKEVHEEKLRKIFQSEVVRVCCLGGGPLPEIVALCMFINKGNYTPWNKDQKERYLRLPSTDEEPGRSISHQPIYPQLSVRNLDLHAESWKQQLDQISPFLCEKPGVYIPMENINPIKCDLTDPEQVTKHIDEVSRSRLIFASKVFSDIWCLDPARVKRNAEFIIRNIQPGSFFVYMDNQNGASVSWFCEYKWKDWGFVQICSYDDSYEPEHLMQSIDIKDVSIFPGNQDKRIFMKVYYREKMTDGPRTSELSNRTRQASDPSDEHSVDEYEGYNEIMDGYANMRQKKRDERKKN